MTLMHEVVTDFTRTRNRLARWREDVVTEGNSNA